MRFGLWAFQQELPVLLPGTETSQTETITGSGSDDGNGEGQSQWGFIEAAPAAPAVRRSQTPVTSGSEPLPSSIKARQACARCDTSTP